MGIQKETIKRKTTKDLSRTEKLRHNSQSSDWEKKEKKMLKFLGFCHGTEYCSDNYD